MEIKQLMIKGTRPGDAPLSRGVLYVGIAIALVIAAILLTFLRDGARVIPNTSAPFPEPGYKRAMTTLFWIGEESGPENSFIPNDESYFLDGWMEHYGGVDSPNDRCGYLPCGFTPHENPFYFALPYGDLDHDGKLKPTASRIPWYASTTNETGRSIVKDTWIEIKYRGLTCYGQWEDVGPNGEDDVEYVFGDAKTPQNSINNDAGLDVSPALRTCLGLETNDYTQWRFVEEEEVPPGPWKDIVTSENR